MHKEEMKWRSRLNLLSLLRLWPSWPSPPSSRSLHSHPQAFGPLRRRLQRLRHSAHRRRQRPSGGVERRLHADVCTCTEPGGGTPFHRHPARHEQPDLTCTWASPSMTMNSPRTQISCRTAISSSSFSDDDHSGSLFQLNDNVLSLVAGSPNFKIVM